MEQNDFLPVFHHECMHREDDIHDFLSPPPIHLIHLLDYSTFGVMRTHTIFKAERY